MKNRFLDAFARFICIDVEDWDSDFENDGYTDVLGLKKLKLTPEERDIFYSAFGLQQRDNLLDVRPHLKRQAARVVCK